MRNSANFYATLVSSVEELKYLRGLDTGEKLDQRDKIRATASRVGLSVPTVSHVYHNAYYIIDIITLIYQDVLICNVIISIPKLYR